MRFKACKNFKTKKQNAKVNNYCLRKIFRLITKCYGTYLISAIDSIFWFDAGPLLLK